MVCNTGAGALRRLALATGLAALVAPHASAQDGGRVSSLPGGSTSIRETYQDWVVSCAQSGNGKSCKLSQQQIDARSRQRALAIELQPSPGEGATGNLVLPFGLALAKGATLQIDNAHPLQPLPFSACFPIGCVVALVFSAEEVAAL